MCFASSVQLTAALLGAWVAAGTAEGPPFSDLLPSTTFDDGPWAPALLAEVAEARDAVNGEIFFYVSDPWRGFRFRYRAGQPTYLASGVKMAFMVEVFRQREHGRLTFDEEILYTEDDIRDGAPRMNRLDIGTRVKISTLLDWMMRSSDNAASDMLARRVGLHSISDGLIAEGIVGFQPLTYLIDVRRGIFRGLDIAADDLTPYQVREVRWTDIWSPQLRRLEALLGKRPTSFTKEALWAAYDRFYATRVNAASMNAVGLMLEKMCRGELVSVRASREMLALMQRGRTSTHRLLGQLPEGTPVSHKTGSQFRRLCDMGVITLPDRRPLVVAACISSSDVLGAERAVARLARRSYDLVIAEHRSRP